MCWKNPAPSAIPAFITPVAISPEAGDCIAIFRPQRAFTKSFFNFRLHHLPPIPPRSREDIENIA
jgi:hypothetical protein